ncbi:peptide-methionine (R)-S-oxide reductase MsrB [Pelotalea chapellei]|nr:peptide-methionine (R)-S-oxide reductase MsrB [Pelotalea chapellei]
MNTFIRLLILMIVATAVACSGGNPSSPSAETGAASTAPEKKIKLYSATRKGYVMSNKVFKSEAEWRKQLTAEQFHVAREKGTERAYSGATWNNHEKGIYQCICCGNDLYSSEHKYESGTGWPSFWQPIAPENIATRPDNSLFSHRTEVVCSRCDAHLGHVFEDGPRPTGLRYCMNSAAMKFVKTS